MNHLCCLTISAAFCHAAKARNSQKNSLQNQLHSLFCPFVSPYYLADVDAESQYDGEEYEDDGGEEDDEEEGVLAEETLNAAAADRRQAPARTAATVKVAVKSGDGRRN